MVWPVDREFTRNINGKNSTFYVPRLRQYIRCETRLHYTVIIQSYKTDNALPIVKLGKLIYERFNRTELFYVSHRKIKVMTDDIDTANRIAADCDLNSKYMVMIPSEFCEAKGICPIPAEYSEEDIFKFCKPRNLAEFGEVSDSCLITEVRRFQRNSKDSSSHNKIDINLVSICFSGNVLPSHVCIDSMNFPVKPYREPVLQCRKCWHYKHNERVCSKKFSVCPNCGLGHDLSIQCPNSTSCVNCKGSHSAASKDCPIFLRFLNENIEKANKLKPKYLSALQPSVTFTDVTKLDLRNFPPLDSVRTKINKPSPTFQKLPSQKRVRTEEPAAPSIASPPLTDLSPQKSLQTSLNSNSSEPMLTADETIAEEVTIGSQSKPTSPNLMSFKLISDTGSVSYIPLAPKPPQIISNHDNISL